MQMMVKQISLRIFSHQHVVADVSQLLLNLLPVLFGLRGVRGQVSQVQAPPHHLLLPLRPLRLLLYARNYSPRAPPGSDDIFVGYREQVPLLVGQLDAGLGDGLHRGSHVVIPGEGSQVSVDEGRRRREWREFSPLRLLGQLGPLYQLILLSHGEA